MEYGFVNDERVFVNAADWGVNGEDLVPDDSPPTLPEPPYVAAGGHPGRRVRGRHGRGITTVHGRVVRAQYGFTAERVT